MICELHLVLYNTNSYVPSFQQHLNIMRSTYKLLTSDFVELEMAFRDCVKGVHRLAKDQAVLVLR